MKTTSRKSFTIIAVLLFFISGLAAFFIFFWNGSDIPISENEVLSPRYFVFQGTLSKIYLISATLSYSFSNETYTSADGSEIPKGSALLVISLALRNDYTKDDPPPPMGTPVSPVDGTAYVCLSFNLRSKDGIISAVNVTPADFRSTSPDETGIVIASGQTNHTDMYLATNRTDISQFEINLTFVGDSIPR